MTAQLQRPRTARAKLLAHLPVEDRHRRFAGISTAVLEGGEGPPVVLLHGPGESSLWWMRVIPQLVNTNRVIVPDLPGHGDSDASEHTLTADGVFEWLEALIEETCPTPPTLVGHVLGGAIAARFVTSYDDTAEFADHDDTAEFADRSGPIERLVLVDSLGLGRFRPSARFALGLLRFYVRPTERAYLGFFGQCMADRDRVIEEMGADWEPFLEYYLESIRTPRVKTAMRTLMKGVGVPPIPPEDLERIAVPTTLIWGRDDRAVRLGIAKDASSLYDWPLHVIENARDDPKLERPDAFLDALSVALDT